MMDKWIYEQLKESEKRYNQLPVWLRNENFNEVKPDSEKVKLRPINGDVDNVGDIWNN